MEIIENWKPIQNLNGKYEISDLGNLRRTDNRQPVKTQRHRQGYRLIQLKTGGGTRFQASVHSVVAETFIGPRPTGLVICHGNDDPADNRLVNLRYATQAENMADAIRNGRTRAGCPNMSAAKLTPDDVRAIRIRRAAGEAGRALAAEYGVNEQTICRAYRRANWKSIN